MDYKNISINKNIKYKNKKKIFLIIDDIHYLHILFMDKTKQNKNKYLITVFLFIVVT